MGTVADSFYAEVLQRIGAPVTTENMRACHAWQLAEGGRASFNPWNTTQPEPGATNYNSFGPGNAEHVRNYPSQPVGVDAIVSTLKNGHYSNILSAFGRGSDGAAVCLAVDGSPWGTHGAHTEYLKLYGSAPTPVHRELMLVNPYLHGSDVRQVQEALTRHGFPTVADSVFGPATDKSVRAFQKSRHLTQDGVVGPRTRAALGLSA